MRTAVARVKMAVSESAEGVVFPDTNMFSQRHYENRNQDPPSSHE